MIGTTFTSVFLILAVAIVFGGCCVVIAIEMARNARTSHDTRSFNKGWQRLSQQQADSSKK